MIKGGKHENNHFFIVFAIFYSIFDWIIKKTDLHNKLLDKPRRNKYTRFILVIILILFLFFLEYVKQLLNDSYGRHNYMTTILGALLGSIYLNFASLIFKRNKS